MDLSQAVRAHPEGCVISFEIAPGSSSLKVPSGFNPWRRSIEARLTEEPFRGRANRQLVEELSRLLGISTTRVELLSGQKSAKKTVLLRRVSMEDAISALSQGMK